MAKFSLRHPVRSLGNIVRDVLGIGPRKPEPPPQPPPPPPPPPPPGPDFFGRDPYEYDRQREDIWRDVTNEAAWVGTDWYDLFTDTGIPAGRTNDQIDEAWRAFLQAFYLTSRDAGSLRRQDFYEVYDIGPELIGWDAWREMIDTP